MHVVTTRPTHSGRRLLRLGMAIMAACLVTVGCQASTPAAKPAPPTAAQPASQCETVTDVTTAAPGLCRFDGQTLRVAATAGQLMDFIKAGAGKLFEEYTGGKIEWIVADPPTALSQLIATKGSPPPFDVVADMDGITAIRAEQAGVIAKVDYSKIPNAASLPPQAYHLPGYGFGAWYFIIGNCYNTEQFSAAGVPAPTSLDSWFDPRLARRVAFPDPTNPRWPIFMPGIAQAYGYSVTDPTPTIEKIAQIPGLRLYSSAAALDQEYLSGDVWLAMNSDGRCNALTAKGLPYKFAPLGLNVDGKQYDYFVSATGPEVVQGSTNTAMAYFFMNLMLSGPGILPLATQLIYTPTGEQPTKVMAADPKYAPYVFTRFDNMFVPNYGDFLPTLNTWIEAWNKRMKG